MSIIDLTQLPAPAVVEELDFETIFDAMIADLKVRDPTFDALVESDPAYKILEVAAYRELLLRQRVNDAARAVMLATATGSDLDNLGALYGVERLLLDAGDPAAIPPVPPTYEDDTRFRQRIQLAPEAVTTAGSAAGYEYHALSASSDVLDVDVSSPAAGDVQITVLSIQGDGTPDQALLDAVTTALSDKKVRPLTDQVTVLPAGIITYTVDATLYLYPGFDTEVVRLAAEDTVGKYTAERRRLGHDITLSGLHAALHQPGVQRVELAAPGILPIAVSSQQSAYCSSVSVTVGGTDE